MLQSNGASGEENSDFSWGAEQDVGRGKNTTYYESFTYEGVEYRLFDSAYFLVDGQCETSIGKLVKMYQTSAGEKKVKVVWFFRPRDIHRFLGDYNPQWDELFLACGDGKGVYSIHDADEVIGKCNVLCVSTDQRNPQPARHELRSTSYVFSCTFDTRLNIISEDFADAIAGIRVENFFNKVRDKQSLNRLNASTTASSSGSAVRYSLSKLGEYDNRDGKLTSRTSTVKKEFFWKDGADHVPVKKDPPVNFSRVLKMRTRAVEDLLATGSSVNPKPSTMRKLNKPESDDYSRREGTHYKSSSSWKKYK